MYGQLYLFFFSVDALHVPRVNPTAMSLKAGCELFLRYTTRTSALELSEFDMAKAHLIEVGECALSSIVHTMS